MLPATAEASDLEAARLEKQDELKDVEARHAESMKKVEACEARITQLEKGAKRVEDEKNFVEKELGAIDGVRQVNVDSMAAVHDMTVKTLESDLENMKRLKKLLIEKALGLQLERDGLEAQIEDLEWKVTNDAAVSSLGESEVSRREIFAELEQVRSKIQGLEMDLEATQTKLGAGLDDVASLKQNWAQGNASESGQSVRSHSKFKAESEAKSKEIEHQKVKMEELKLEASEGALLTGDLESAKAIAETQAASQMSSIFDEIKKVGKARAQRVKVVGYSLIGSQCEVAKDTPPEFHLLQHYLEQLSAPFSGKAALISTKQDDIKQLKEKIAHHGNKLESANLFKKHEKAGIHARAIDNLTKKQNAAEKVISASRPEAERNGKLYEVILAQLKSSNGEIDTSKMKLLLDTLLDKKEQISTWTPNFIAQEFVNLGLGSVPGFTPGAAELTLTMVEAALRLANLSPETIAAVKQNLGVTTPSGEEVVAGNTLQSEIESLKRQIDVLKEHATKAASVLTPQNES
ncbi:hypothetical protein HDU78_010795, partial [Chytriomyces hyalinus]